MVPPRARASGLQGATQWTRASLQAEWLRVGLSGPGLHQQATRTPGVGLPPPSFLCQQSKSCFAREPETPCPLHADGHSKGSPCLTSSALGGGAAAPWGGIGTAWSD